jgi:predicted Ser/Thr protein kinase
LTATVLRGTDLKFEKVIGKGSFAVVHRGKWRGNTVALKIRIPPGFNTDNLSNFEEIEVLRYGYQNICVYAIPPPTIYILIGSSIT